MLRKLAILSGLLLTVTSCGENETELAKSYRESADALAAKVGKPGEKTEVPLPSDPDAKRFEEQAGKALTALGTDALPISGFDTYEPLCAKAANIGGSYAMAGATLAEKAAALPAVEAAKMATRAEELFNQMLTPVLFAAHCSALHLPALEEMVASSSGPDASALNQMRSGTSQQVQGLIQMASGDDLQLPVRTRILNVLAGDASKFAIGLTPQQRQEIVSIAQRLKQSAPREVAGQADKIRTDIESAPCGKLCSV